MEVYVKFLMPPCKLWSTIIIILKLYTHNTTLVNIVFGLQLDEALQHCESDKHMMTLDHRVKMIDTVLENLDALA